MENWLQFSWIVKFLPLILILCKPFATGLKLEEWHFKKIFLPEKTAKLNENGEITRWNEIFKFPNFLSIKFLKFVTSSWVVQAMFPHGRLQLLSIMNIISQLIGLLIQTDTIIVVQQFSKIIALSKRKWYQTGKTYRVFFWKSAFKILIFLKFIKIINFEILTQFRLSFDWFFLYNGDNSSQNEPHYMAQSCCKSLNSIQHQVLRFRAKQKVVQIRTVRIFCRLELRIQILTGYSNYIAVLAGQSVHCCS